MHRSKLAVLITIGLVSLAGITGLSVRSQPVDRPTADGVEPGALNPPQQVAETTDTGEPREYVVIASSAAAIERARLANHGTVGTQTGRRVELTTTPETIPTVENISWVRTVRPVRQIQPTTVAGAGTTNTLGVSKIHDRGVTGDGVTVGIIDDGYNTTTPAIADNVAAVKRFSSPGGTAHGTGVATTVVKTAPDVKLYLTTARTGVDTEAAIQYLVAQDVDIIVFSAGFLTADDDGRHFLTDDIQQARQAGTLFMASAGNQANLHWQGQFSDPDSDGVANISATDERLCVPACGRTYSGTIQVAVHWDADGDGSEYRVLLDNPFRSGVLASSTLRDAPAGEGVSYLDYVVSQQPVDIIIQHVGGPADDNIELLVNGPPQIERPVARSSLTVPADTASAVAVAAYRRDTAAVTAYSSRGPTDDGRVGVDVTGYTNIVVSDGDVFTGTSAAAPYVGGVAALVEQASTDELTPSQVETALRNTSDSTAPSRPSTVSGAGVVNATAAVAAVAPVSSVREPLALTGGSLSPQNVTATQSVTHTIELTAANLSTDEQTTIKITFPQNATITNSTQTQVVDATATTIPLQQPPTIVNAGNGTANRLRVAVTPSSTANTTQVTMTTSVTITYASVANTTRRPVTARVNDSAGRSAGPTAIDQVTVAPTTDTSQSPLSGLPGQFDDDADGDITAAELGGAVDQFASNQLTAAELGEVVIAYASD